ncbi:hypothetical protein [Microcoleus asticus]|uniref:hypothetical protein n=1 Tax=Microcoleus asticus TaxID=2815231 RepID=UPI001554D064|nr:hypothetical protein [Microcoleus asticus]
MSSAAFLAAAFLAAAFLAAAFFPRVSDDRKSAPWSNALPASLFATEEGRTHERGTSTPLDDRLGILLVLHIDCIY